MTITRESILQKAKEILSDKLNVSMAEITEEKTLKDLGADSMDAADAIMEIEDQFDIAIPDDDMEKLTDIKSIVDYIQSYTVKK